MSHRAIEIQVSQEDLEQIRSRIVILEGKSDENTKKIEAVQGQTEKNEQHSRKKNLRVYGLKQTQDAQAAAGSARPKLKNPRQAFNDLLINGLGFSQQDAKGMLLSACFWEQKGNYLLASFVSDEQRSRVLSKRTKLGSEYKPDGKSVSLRDDATKAQIATYKAANEVCKVLRNDKKVKASTIKDKIKYGGALYKPDDPVIQELLAAPPLDNE
ncbi:hypothetical protein [Pseudoalteromonas sp.]|uniref:hypothetical protein n=1 Tax=Pseudoalteromonas sp. TaxID=53249 RepID=UPI00262B5F3A|nr:hypothetical protein [Pseudoalteromonas sp.]MCP4585890.1 hypothetical protein [Pseudoalteromonas sp.]